MPRVRPAMPWSTSKHPGSTRASRRTRTLVLHRDPTCYLHYDGCTVTSTDDDHVIPLSQGGTDSLDNRRGACQHCHNIKTQTEALAARPRLHRQPEPHPGLHPRSQSHSVTPNGGPPPRL
ncbi:MAG: HNH endonuclease [Gemmatimonadaceae bacterium]